MDSLVKPPTQATECYSLDGVLKGVKIGSNGATDDVMAGNVVESFHVVR